MHRALLAGVILAGCASADVETAHIQRERRRQANLEQERARILRERQPRPEPGGLDERELALEEAWLRAVAAAEPRPGRPAARVAARDRAWAELQACFRQGLLADLERGRAEAFRLRAGDALAFAHSQLGELRCDLALAGAQEGTPLIVLLRAVDEGQRALRQAAGDRDPQWSWQQAPAPPPSQPPGRELLLREHLATKALQALAAACFHSPPGGELCADEELGRELLRRRRRLVASWDDPSLLARDAAGGAAAARAEAEGHRDAALDAALDARVAAETARPPDR